jgi:5,10-methenyltetrahydromethanopterin hydrogenase
MIKNYIPEGHVDAETAVIGTIIFDDIIEEKEATNLTNRFKPKSIGECKVEIYPNEGQVPHFHIYNLNKTFQTCI